MRTLIVGYGEVGQGLHEVIPEADVFDIRTSPAPSSHVYQYMHICIPWSDNFIMTVRGYQDQFGKPLTIIHSSVPIGTSRACGAVHSPVRGVHPYLAQGIRTFVKFVGAASMDDADCVAGHLLAHGITVRIAKSPEDTEALKLLDTLQYGLAIVAEKQIYELCQERGLDFNLVYTEANQTYNAGYSALGRPEYAKYVLKHVSGKIGGHCVMENAQLIDIDIARYLQQNGS